jgi:hypothetical protein
VKNYSAMKNVFVFFFVALMAFSCGSTKEVEAEVEDSNTHLRRQAPQTMNREKRRASIDAEQLAAQLGLTEAQEVPFIKMWNGTTEKMQKVRLENRGDRAAMLSGMKAVKAEREEGLQRILTDNQMDLYYEIMQHNRGKLGGTPQKRKG